MPKKIYLLTWVLLGGNAFGAAGQLPRDTLRLADAIAEARAANPMLRAARSGADAAVQRIPQVAALSDPQLSVGLMNRPVRGFGTEEPMTMNQIQVSQALPWPGTRTLSRDRATLQASAEALSVVDIEAEIVRRVTVLYYDIAVIDRTTTVLQRTREILRSYAEVSQARFIVGESPQQDLLRANVTVAQMTEEIAFQEQNRIATAARLNALLGRSSSLPVGVVVLPEIGGPLPAVDSLMFLARAERPALVAARARIRAAEAGVLEAKRAGLPEIMVSAAYGQRPQYDDMVTLMVGLSLPLRPATKQLPLQREMVALQSMAVAESDNLVNETYASLVEARAELERTRNLSTLYRNEILPQAEAAVTSALAAYRVGRVDFMTLVESQMTVNRYTIEAVRLTAQYHQAMAQIDALLGVKGVSQ